MSEENEPVDTCCASCSIAEIGDIKLVPCDGCDLVKYCSDECQQNHKSEHEEQCKKRAAELRDELLFKQPESSYLGDCPICSLPLPLNPSKSDMTNCCSKVICQGCAYTKNWRDDETRRQRTCPFCREPAAKTQEEADKRSMKRVEANDPVAMCLHAVHEFNKRNYPSAFEYFSKAAELGDAEAHHKLSNMYLLGKGVEKDVGKHIYHLEEAAIGGHPEARYHLGFYEQGLENRNRAVMHWIIAARHGHDKSIKALMEAFRQGFLKKDVLAAVLRLHKRAVDATKSPQRKEAEGFAQFRSTVENFVFSSPNPFSLPRSRASKLRLQTFHSHHIQTKHEKQSASEQNSPSKRKESNVGKAVENQESRKW